MKTQAHIDNFSSTLRKLLNRELELGNAIAETSQGWPDTDTIIVFLDQPFKEKYQFNHIEYRNIDDPHYWKAEYFDQVTKHILACKF